MFNESFVSLIFGKGQRVSMHARVLSIVFDGVDQAVTGGSWRHSRLEGTEYSILYTINESIAFDLVFADCLTCLSYLVEIVGNSFFYNLVIEFSADQTPRHPFIALWMGMQCQSLQSISHCRDIGWVVK